MKIELLTAIIICLFQPIMILIKLMLLEVIEEMDGGEEE